MQNYSESEINSDLRNKRHRKEKYICNLIDSEYEVIFGQMPRLFSLSLYSLYRLERANTEEVTLIVSCRRQDAEHDLVFFCSAKKVPGRSLHGQRTIGFLAPSGALSALLKVVLGGSNVPLTLPGGSLQPICQLR